MSPLTPVDVLATLSDTSPHVVAARAAAQRGAEISGLETRTSAEELLGIYSIRADHVGRTRTAHAATLAADLRALCQALADCPARLVTILRVAEPSGRYHTFFLDADTTALLGSVVTYNVLVISQEKYHELWGFDRLN